MTRDRAAAVLRNPCLRRLRLAELYDVDAEVRAAVNLLFVPFEYPDYSHYTVAQLCQKPSARGGPRSRGAG